MRTLTVTEFISLDGVVDSPGGEEGYRHSGWTFDIEPDPDMYGSVGGLYAGATALLLGRTTYDGFAAAWPARESDEGGEGDMARQMGDLPKYAVSTTLTDPAWRNTTVLASVAEVATLREGDGGPILVAGSASLVRALHVAGFVDRYHLLVFPVVLGSGLRLFPSDADDKQKLMLAEHATYANGVQLQVFDVVH